MAIENLDLLGIAGAAIILLAWAYETAKEVRQHQSMMDLKYSFISLVGVVLLIIYSGLANLPIFFWLNIAIMLIIGFEIWYSLHIRKIHLDNRRLGRSEVRQIVKAVQPKRGRRR